LGSNLTAPQQVGGWAEPVVRQSGTSLRLEAPKRLNAWQDVVRRLLASMNLRAALFTNDRRHDSLVEAAKNRHDPIVVAQLGRGGKGFFVASEILPVLPYFVDRRGPGRVRLCMPLASMVAKDEPDYQFDGGSK
jgi:hypothetical protein